MQVTIKVTLPSGHVEEMTPEQARALVQQLRTATGDAPPLPVDPAPWRPSPLIQPYPWQPPYTVGDAIPNPFEITARRAEHGA